MNSHMRWIAAVLFLLVFHFRAAGAGVYCNLTIKTEADSLIANHRYEEAREKLLNAAESGDACAQSILGKMYFFGMGVTVDYLAAMKWRAMAALRGLPDAQYQLAGMYLFGYGVAIDIRRAMYWLEISARNNNISSQILLGKIYENGLDGIGSDLCQSSRWYQMATEAGDPLGYYLLRNILSKHKDGISCDK
jgi:TPR repeat protein